MADNESGNDPNKGRPDEAGQDDGSAESRSYRDMLLDSLKSKSGGKSAANWVEKLANDTQQAIGHQATLKLPGNFKEMYMQESVTSWVDKMFDCFLEYAYDFNPAVAGTNLEITWDRPVLFNETVKESKWRDASTKVWHFKGTVQTRAWSLLLRGSKGSIYAYIVPNDMLIALSSPTISFNAYLEMLGSFDRGTVRWTIDGTEIAIERVEEVAQDLFGALIRVARGEQGEDEKSHLHATAHKPPPPIPHQSLTGKYKVFSGTADQTESMKISFSPDYIPKNNDLLRDSGVYKLPPKDKPAAAAGAAEAKKAAIESAAEKAAESAAAPAPPPAEPKAAEKEAESMKTQEKEKTPMPAADIASAAPVESEKVDAAAPPQESAKDAPKEAAAVEAVKAEPVKAEPVKAEPAKAEPVTQKKEETAGGSVSDKAAGPQASKGIAPQVVDGGVDLMVDGKEVNVSQACDLLVGVIDRDLEILAKAGSDAFTNRDMKAAEEALKKSATLNSFRDQISNLLGQLKEQL